MTNPNRRKGDAFERALVAYFREHGFPYAERAYGAGRPDDVGDLDGVGALCVSAKDCGTARLPEWLAEVEDQRERGRKRLGVVIWKRRRRPIGETYVVMTLASFCELVREDG